MIPVALRDEYPLEPVPLPEQGTVPEEEAVSAEPGDADDPVGYFKGDIYGGELWTVQHYLEASGWEQEMCRALIPAHEVGEEQEPVGYRLDDGRLRFPEHCTEDEREAGEPLVYADR